jgi:hypothetical protein
MFVAACCLPAITTLRDQHVKALLGGQVAAKRQWMEWPGRAAQELNGVSGVAGLGGIAISAGGLAILTGTAALALTGAGGVIVAAAVGYALVKGMPPPRRNPQDLVGHVVEIDELKNVSPAPLTLAIIGPEQAGKTTLRNRLLFDSSLLERTQRISAFIVSLQTTPPKYYAILDGGGEVLAQQFKIAGICDCLCVVIDHNKSDSDVVIDPDRLSQHETFLTQVRHYLDELGAQKKLWVRFLINKHDLWGLDASERQTRLNTICKAEVEKWRLGNRAKKIDFRLHSNKDPHDVASFMDLLKGKQ